MRKKVLKLVMTFRTTADAMAAEKACKIHHLPGRLIPVPTSISAGCGLAWCTEPAECDALKQVMREAGVVEEGIHECMIMM